jgi:hypothetical protein
VPGSYHSAYSQVKDKTRTVETFLCNRSHAWVVIPAKPEIQLRLTVACKLDPDFRRGDE